MQNGWPLSLVHALCASSRRSRFIRGNFIIGLALAFLRWRTDQSGQAYSPPLTMASAHPDHPRAGIVNNSSRLPAWLNTCGYSSTFTRTSDRGRYIGRVLSLRMPDIFQEPNPLTPRGRYDVQNPLLGRQ